ncbi:MAG: glycosyltransferase family 2 protein [Ignavibacteria bacterium]|nr:glycosyltransferase family 2 protein [Ignavibacteria bacterium]
MLSVTIICKNEENHLRECLESVKWADEIIVVDSLSTDDTVSIAMEYTHKVFLQKWQGYAKQREFALSKTTNDWVFPLDADERCSPELKDEILSIINSKTNFSGFRIPRKSYFLKKWIKHGGWYPGYIIRLFIKENTVVTDRHVHEGYEVKGDVGQLKGAILHYTISSISDYVKKINNYSSLQALEKSEKKQIKFSDILFRPAATFLQQFFIRKSFLDGIYGLMVTFFDVITNMLTYVKAWEIQNKTENK